MLFTVDAVKLSLEVIELLEGRLAHQFQYAVAGVFWSHFQSAADVPCDEFACIGLRSSVGGLVLAVIKEQVVAHAASDEALLDSRQGVDGMINVEQLAVVGIKVGADLRMDATGSLAAFAGVEVTAVHAVHVGRRPAQVAEVAFEVGHRGNQLNLVEYAFFGAAGNELALVG